MQQGRPGGLPTLSPGSQTPGFPVPPKTQAEGSPCLNKPTPRPPDPLPALLHDPCFHPQSPAARDSTHWGTMVIWTKQMKRKTSEAQAT